MSKNIFITDFNEVLQYQDSTKVSQSGIFILNGVIEELIATPHIGKTGQIDHYFPV